MNGPTIEEAEFNLRDFLAVGYRRRWVIMVPFLAVLGAAVGLSLATPPVYRASTTVTTDKTPPVVLLDKGDLSILADQAATQAPDVFTLAELIKSAAVRDGAIARLAVTVGTDAANGALGGLNVQQVRDTELVRITVDSTEPTLAAAAANAVAESLIDMNLRARRRRATETRRFIDEQLAQASQRLRASEVALVEFKNLHGDVSLAEETTLSLQKLAELEAKRVELRLPREEAQSLIAALQNRLATLEIELSGLQREFTDRHPAVLSARAKIDETRRRLAAEQSRNRQTEHTRERTLAAAIAQYEGKIRAVPTREAELARLTRSRKEAEEIYLLLSTKLQQALIAEASIGSAVQVVDVAKVPQTPAKPRARRTVLVGTILGLAIGLMGALAVEHLDDTVRSADDAERALGKPVLGTIPRSPQRFVSGNRRSRKALTPRRVDLDRLSMETEAYRALRTHVLSAFPENNRRCLLVTSALPHEGKSTVAANLALAFARAEHAVWLLNCDLRRPGLDEMFPEAASPGLAMFLGDRVTIEEVVRATDDPELWFVAAGIAGPNAAELLGSQRMARLIGEARIRAKVTVLDCPAVLTTADAEVIGAHVDGALLVAEAGKTDRRALAQARQRLERVGVRVAGIVLTGVSPARWNGGKPGERAGKAGRDAVR